ncbi:MAG: LysM peptidoglycan-binding domain-containing protein [Kineosporiaceae bacterium]|nr:LysM peptidoglycan-binding domain-containing protein [Kineosporiaceae bacterium]
MSDASTPPEAAPTQPTSGAVLRSAPRHACQPDAALEAMVRRVKLPDGAPAALRTAGVPLLTAALVATGQGAAHATPEISAATTAGSSAVAAGQSATQAPAHPTYRVREGDTLAEIARRTGLSVPALIEANHLSPTGLIRIGQVLVLPGLKTPASAAGQPATTHPAGRTGGTIYLVQPGDTVAAIAEHFGISPASIVRANKLANPSRIRPGLKLRLPGVPSRARTHPASQGKPATAANAGTNAGNKAGSKTPAPTPTRPYTVKAGDTLIGISQAQKVALEVLLKLNGLTQASVIHPDQVLRLPAPPAPKVPDTFNGRKYPAAVAQAAAANRAELAKRAMPTRAQMRQLVQDTAAGMGVDPALALGVAWQESGFNPRVVSPANAIGTMQVIPGTGVWASDLVGRRLDLLKPQDNVTAGVAVLAALLARAKNEDEAIAGYYQGLASVRARGMFEDTKSYVASVQAHRKRFAAELGKG